MPEVFIKVRGGKNFTVRPKQLKEIKTGAIDELREAAVAQTVAPARRIEGIALPEVSEEKFAVLSSEDIKLVNIKYPLSSGNVFAQAHIYFDRRIGELVYNVIEPPIGDNKLLQEIKGYIIEKLDINFSQIRKNEATAYLDSAFARALAYFKVKLDKDAIDTLHYYVMRDFIGLEKIEPLVRDRFIEDISCDGVNIPIFVYHRYPQFGSIKTNITFSNRDELDSFVNKLAERCGRTISIAKPLLDGTLPDGSRLQATLGTDIARNGSNFTIRMFSEKPMTPVDIIKSGTCDLKMMAYFWFLVEHGSSILISGGTASGKTSLLNVLSLFIKPQMKIISIEDTSELRLPHTHWVPEVARTPISEEGKVDMFELLRESLRQRPDYIIVGEVRGKEAYVLFQQMAVGHPGLSTVHAENFPKLLDRMTSPPINLQASLLQNLDLIIFLKRVKQGKKYIRRAFSLIEVVGYDQNAKAPVTNEPIIWDARTDTFTTVRESTLLKKIADMAGMSQSDVREEIEQRAKVIKWMVKRNITDYKKIASIISTFYLSPDFLLGRIEREV